VLKWLQLLKTFFNAREGSTEHGVKLALLQAGAYKDMMMVGQYLDLPTPALKERASAAVRGVVARGKGSAEDAASLVEAERMAEVLLRIARTRCGNHTVWRRLLTSQARLFRLPLAAGQRVIAG
jgi:hypothetical protein